MGARWAAALAASPLRERVSLVGLVDIDLGTAERVRQDVGLTDAAKSTSLADILAQTRPDIVFDVALPSTRKDVVLTAFSYGCDVLTEKPLAASLQDADAILAAAKASGRLHAVTQNRRMASAMGIRTGRVDALTFGLGSGVAGLAGVALSQIDNVSPNLGQSYIIDSFMVVVFGGVGNLWGTLISALTLGVANKLLEPYAGAVLGKIALLVFIILFIQKRPRGLFALKGRAIES